MKTILVIDDGSTSAQHAAHFALSVARQVKPNLVLARVCALKQPLVSREYQLVGRDITEFHIPESRRSLSDELRRKAAASVGFTPLISDFNAILDTEAQLTSYINKNNIWLLVKGVGEFEPLSNDVKIHAVLNRVACPLMLIPEKYDDQPFKHIIHIADLRYCRLNVLRYLAQLARPFNADILLAHLSAKGLPHIEQNYALTLFSDEISKRVDYNRLYFNNTQERDVTRAVDVMVHTMNADLLAVVHHRFHCEELVTQGADASVPIHITIPVMIFSC
ncbi:universal stress protein [Mucilaginibacter celer]|uniref:Universal stress protein n=1 Tax=Mucilaginibacter celer TaxID=2305508 RepID=A0A494VW08_9SPHI|nr:universal stress protein [Mucilaginibacter celer]AYL95172.1 hypothetical protein HYN43_007635 [Mucilaginibacter celer]